MPEGGGTKAMHGSGGGNRYQDKRLTLRPSTRADVLELFGDELPSRIVGITAVVDGRAIGMGALAHNKNGALMAFMRATDEARRYPVSMHRAGLQLMAQAYERGERRIIALADPSIEASRRWLARLGFEPEMIDDQEVWIWQTR